ncbi:pumilio homolog 24 [Oryza glaberrima]|uniref:pumilio homolog 24 n=1 Tax=Oryza glaberrima TaxID=4538 RepID=UPI00224C4735|nr:pumilio homolog 24 [Oryza glaberrima]
MAGGGDLQSPKKRKRDAARKPKTLAKGGDDGKKWKRPSDANMAQGGGGGEVKVKKEPVTAKEKRLAAKEMAESRKKKRKRNYSLEKELTVLWEKMRCHNVSSTERSKLVSEALRKMDGKYSEIAGSHVTARVLQTCVKLCSQSERDAIFEALQPDLLTLSLKKYAVFLVKKLIKRATKKQFEWFISSLHGRVAKLLRHTIGASVVDFAYQLAMPPQKRRLLLELYSTELQLFTDLAGQKTHSLLETISNLGLQKSSVLQHMTTMIYPILEKGIVEYPIVHTAVLEYFTIADKTSATDVIRQFIPLLTQGSSAIDGDEPSVAPELQKKLKAKKKRLTEPLLVRIMNTREGLKIGVSCLKHGSAKDRKKIIKSLKGHIMKLALSDYGCILLVAILSIVDDTKLVTKIVIQELAKHLKQLIFDKNGRRPLLQLLHPNCSRYLPPADLACLNYRVPSLISKDEASESAAEDIPENKVDVATNKEQDGSEGMQTENKVDAATNKEQDGSESMQSASDSKKDPFQRRHELLIKSELAEVLIQTLIENVGELLRTNFGKDVLHEVAVGGEDNILEGITDRIYSLHNAIASDAARPKTEDTEHAFDNYHSSRLIRRLILESPAFAAILWKKALEGKCKTWADGHSSKVVAAFLESPDSKVRDLAKAELQPLVDRGILKIPDYKAVEK